LLTYFLSRKTSQLDIFFLAFIKIDQLAMKWVA